MPPTTCPHADELQRYALGHTPEPEAERLEEHLRRCRACLTSLAALRVDDTLLEAVRAQAGATRAPDDHTVSEVIARLKELQATDAPTLAPAPANRPDSAPLVSSLTLSSAADSAAASTEGSLQALLEPARGPGELGWLGPYRVLRLLGAGGMGAVFAAEDPHLERPVALKVMLPALAATPTARQRFLREAKAAAAVKHDNIVTVYAVGEASASAGSVTFLAMEFLRGEPLDDRLRREGRLPAAEVVRIGGEVARGLAAAHARGLVHRDVKPANVWLDADSGRSKILDFGLARTREPHGPELTQQGAIVGTPAYIAPEQTDGRPVDGRTDLFSLGCVLYRMCTGEAPFKGKDTVSTLMAVATDRPKPPREVNPEVPPALSALVLRLLEKNPGQRPAGAAEVAEALDRLARGEPMAQPARPRRRRLLLAGALGLLLVGVLATVLLRIRTPDGGEFTVETDDPAIEVTAQRGGALVRIRDSRNGQEWQLDTGKYTLEQVERPGGLTLELPRRGKLVLRRKGKGAVTIRWLDEKRPRHARVPADALKREDIPEAALAWSGGGDPGRAPPELVAILGDGRFRVFGVGCFPAYSPDGKLLAVPADNTVFLFDAQTGAFQRRLLRHEARVLCVAFSPDGSRLASGGEDATVRLWDVTNGVQLHSFDEHPGDVLSLAFRPDSKALAAGCADGTVRLWDVPTGKLLGSTKAHQDTVWGLAFRPDSRTLVSAAAGPKGSVQVWDTSDDRLPPGGRTVPLVCREPDYARLAFSPHGKRLAVGTGEALRLLDPVTLAVERTLPTNASGLVAFVADGREVLTGNHHYPSDAALHTVERWDVAGRKLRTLRLASKGPWLHPVVSPDGSTLAVLEGAETVVRLYETATGKLRLPDPGHTKSVLGVAFSPDGRLLASGSFDETVRLWDLTTGKQVRTFTGHTDRVVGVAFSPDGKLLASSSFDRTVRLWDVASGRRVQTLTGFAGEGNRVAFSPDGKLVAAASQDRTVRLWSVPRGEEVRVLRLFSDVTDAVCFSPDGRRLAAASRDSIVLVCDVATGKVQQRLKHPCAIRAIAFLPKEDTLLAGGDDGSIRLWSADTGKLRQTLQGPPFIVYGLAARPSGRFFAASGQEGSARLWDLSGTAPRRRTFRLSAARVSVDAVAFSPEGRHLATGNPDGTIYLFGVPKTLPAEPEPGEVRLVDRGPPAPDLSRVKPQDIDTFARDTGFGSGGDKSCSYGYAGGKYFIEVQAKAWAGRVKDPPHEDFACELVGRVAGHPSGWMGLYLENVWTDQGIRVALSGTGRWSLAPAAWEPEPNRGPWGGPAPHPAVKRGNAVNKILLVVRGRRLEVSINGQAVCAPVTLDRDITPGKVGLWAEAEGEKARAEFERLTIWSARDLPLRVKGIR
jgi:WD40 repeat protein/serine/threonine protein kinase